MTEVCTEPFGINGVARLFEGEGTIFAKKRRPTFRRASLYIRVQMNDQDVIEALAAEFGGAAAGYGRRSRPGHIFFQWTLTGLAAALLADAMLPYLFSRRKAQVDSALRAWAEHRTDLPPRLEVYRGCE